MNNKICIVLYRNHKIFGLTPMWGKLGGISDDHGFPQIGRICKKRKALK